MSTALKPQGKAGYTAAQSDKDWLLNVQKKLYARSWNNADYVFRDLWGLVTDPQNLKCSLMRVARNKGHRTAGIDGITVRKVIALGAEAFIGEIRKELREGSFRPSPARRVLIPKSGKPGEFRPLGIPTVKDRVVQAAVKNIMEPIFEADFYPSSFGFRPGKSVHGALEQLRKLNNSLPLRRSQKDEPRLPYQWAIEGDIKGCFDNISHHGLMNRIRRRIGDGKLNRLVVAFLKSGVMSQDQFLRTEVGTPQGGILSPLLANIALSVIEERYTRHSWPRHEPTTLNDNASISNRVTQCRARDKRTGMPVFVPIRYADDFIILVCAPLGPDQSERALSLAEQEKDALAQHLKETLNLELSETKTLITTVTEPIRFLGFHFRVRCHPVLGWRSSVLIPKLRSQRLRERIKTAFKRSTCHQSLEQRLIELNPVLRGWSYFYRHAVGAKDVFANLDNYVWHTIYRWVKKKNQTTGYRKLLKRYGKRIPNKQSTTWSDNGIDMFRMESVSVQRFRSAWDNPPAYALTSRESPVHNERCTPGSEEGSPETER